MPGALGTAMSDFSPQIEEFDGSHFTIIGWDPPGYGKSQPPARDFKNFFRQDAKMAVKTMNNLGYDKFSLLGWSDGGITAMIAAARMRKPMEDIYGSNFPSLWTAWCGAYKDYYDNGGDICRDDLSNITAPALVIHGMKDAMVAKEHIHFLHE